MNLVNFDINAYLGRNGLNKDGWLALITILDDIKQEAREAKAVCEATHNELRTYQLVRKEVDKVGCVPLRNSNRIAISALLISVVHATYDLCVHMAHWAKS